MVEVTGNRPTRVAATPSADSARQTGDAAGLMVLPGLVNTHCHTSQQLGRGLADDVNLLTWLHERIWPYEGALTEAMKTETEIRSTGAGVIETVCAEPGCPILAGDPLVVLVPA